MFLNGFWSRNMSSITYQKSPKVRVGDLQYTKKLSFIFKLLIWILEKRLNGMHGIYPNLIVSITKFSIVIGSPRAYLSRTRRAITWVSNYSCPIGTFCNRTPGYLRDFQVNYARFNGFLSNVFLSFQNLGKALRTLSLKRSS